MSPPQAHPPQRFALLSEPLGPLPLVNHFLQRLNLIALLDRYVPTTDRRAALSHAAALGVLLRSIIVEREPIYRQQETAVQFAAELFGLSATQMAQLGDDRIGRALDRLFDADRTVLLTEVVLAVGQKFAVRFDQLHNDSTSVAFCGQYRSATGQPIRGRTAPAIAYGHSKDHRPDLKQLLFILTTEAESGVPVQFRVADGNTNDSITHIETWNTLRTVAGRADFLYVGDSKLCSAANMQYIDRAGGRFVTVLPRSRLEDAEFRKWVQTHSPPWQLGPVNTNGHFSITLRAWRSPKPSTNRSRAACLDREAMSACPTCRCSMRSCTWPSRAANGADCPNASATGTRSTRA